MGKPESDTLGSGHRRCWAGNLDHSSITVLQGIDRILVGGPTLGLEPGLYTSFTSSLGMEGFSMLAHVAEKKVSATYPTPRTNPQVPVLNFQSLRRLRPPPHPPPPTPASILVLPHRRIPGCYQSGMEGDWPKHNFWDKTA